MADVLSRLESAGLVPVIKLEDASRAIPLAETLAESGLPVAEVTFRTDAAEASIRAIAKSVPSVLVGAGTVLTVDNAKAAMDAGAAFMVTPGFNRKVVEFCLERGIPVTPGINNPTGVESALDLGITTVKFFPSEPSGGIKMIKAMAAPYGMVRFIPTGGISKDNLADYLKVPAIMACGGSWIVPAKKITEGDFDTVGELIKEAVSIVKSVRG